MAPSTLVCMTRSNCSRVGGVAELWASHTPATYSASSIFSPSSCQARPLTLAGSATSTSSTLAPVASTRSRSASLRTVATTLRPWAA